MFLVEFFVWAIGAAVVFTLGLLALNLVIGGLIGLSVKFDDWRAKRK